MLDTSRKLNNLLLHFLTFCFQILQHLFCHHLELVFYTNRIKHERELFLIENNWRNDLVGAFCTTWYLSSLADPSSRNSGSVVVKSSLTSVPVIQNFSNYSFAKFCLCCHDVAARLWLKVDTTKFICLVIWWFAPPSGSLFSWFSPDLCLWSLNCQDPHRNGTGFKGSRSGTLETALVLWFSPRSWHHDDPSPV